MNNTKKNKQERTIDYVHIYITRKCNLHCLHCFTESDSQIEEILPVSFWKNAIKQLVYCIVDI